MKTPRIIGRHSEKIEKFYKFSKKNQKYPAINPTTLIIITIKSVIFSNKLSTSVIMKID